MNIAFIHQDFPGGGAEIVTFDIARMLEPKGIKVYVFVYNLKASEVSQRLRALRALPFVVSAESHESGKYDFSNVLDIAMNKIPSKYYNIRGKIDDTLI